ncbi:MAG: aminotransferase class V-fold PLP-dependent enzyme [Coriobacteriales bacterium]|nr:aminotransferase class V-fold PLP-dependent enzyme [Coriobacteriales bacterium]
MTGSSNDFAPIYLNNAATSFPKPDCVAEAMAQAVSSLPGGDNRDSMERRNVNDELRIALAELLHAPDHRRIVLGSNATWGLNEAIFGLGLATGDCIVASMAEHNSVIRPVEALANKGVKVEYVPVDVAGRIDSGAWKTAIEQHSPKIAICTHASNVTGAINDVAKLAAIAKEHGAITLVDAAQTLGLVEIDASDPNIDMIAFTGHKYLLGPQGTGGLFVGDGIELEPHAIGGTGVRSDLAKMPDEYPMHLEAGTSNEPSNAGLLAAIRWAKDNPIDIDALTEKCARLRDGLAGVGAKVIDPGAPSTPVVSFTIEGLAPGYVGELLFDCYDVICRTGLHCAPKIFGCLGDGLENGTVRISLSRFTTDDEIDALIGAVDDIVSSETGF